MDKTETLSRVRALGFMAGVLDRQGHEPLCSKCISLALTIEATRQALKSVQKEMDKSALNSDFEVMFKEATDTIMSAKSPEDPIKQRKIGMCKLPEKTCLVKKSRKMFLYFAE